MILLERIYNLEGTESRDFSGCPEPFGSVRRGSLRCAKHTYTQLDLLLIIGVYTVDDIYYMKENRTKKFL